MVRTRSPIVWMLLWVLVCSPAAAQDIDQLIAAGRKHLSALQYGPALQQFTQVPDTATPAQRLDKHVGIAIAMMGVSNFTAVTPHIDAAMKLAADIGTDSAMARAKDIQGEYQRGTKTGDLGLAVLHEAEQLAVRAGDRRTLAGIYTNLMNSYVQLEDFERQTYYSQKQYELVEHPTISQQFNFRVSRGIAFFEMYDRDAAEKSLLAALDLAAQTGRPRDRSFALGELAFLYHTFDRDYPRALRLYDEAVEYARAAKVAEVESNWIVNRANVYRDMGEYARAERDYKAAIAINDANGSSNRTFHIWKNLGQVMRLTGRTKEAAALLDKLLRERAQFAAQRHLWQAHMELASALVTLGDRDGARRHFDAMIDVLEEQRKSRILDAFRTGSFAHALSAYDPYDRYIRFLIEGGETGAVDALGIAERARARSFLESLASVRGAVASKVPPALLAEEATIARAISAAQERLRSTTLDKAQRDAALAALTAAEEAREAFIVEMRVEHPNLAEARYPSLLTAGEIQAALRPGETAIAYFLSEPSSLRWTVTPSSIRVDSLASRSDIERAAGRLRDLLRAPSSPSDVRDAASRLSAELLTGVDLAAAAPLIVIPHGVLHYVPFEVLPAGGRLIVEQRAVSYAPSLNALVQLRRSPSSTEAFRVLAVGNPLDESGRGADARATRAGQPDAIENLGLLAPLPYAEQELQAIGRTFPERTRILSGASARESDLRSPLTARFPLIHFATHGLVSDVQPKRSGLLLAPEQGEDGLLQMSEIYGLGLKANLIVLSACQTALGKEITGEGLIGLSRAFFYAGARSVVATLWNLNDRFAAEFVERFYRELNTGVNPEEALRRAKAAYVNHPRYSHPFYWSSLVLLGDGTMPLVLEPVQRSAMLPAAAGILVALAFTSAVVTSKNRNKSAG